VLHRTLVGLKVAGAQQGCSSMQRSAEHLHSRGGAMDCLGLVGIMHMPSHLQQRQQVVGGRCCSR
jgi:hypothetical protein